MPVFNQAQALAELRKQIQAIIENGVPAHDVMEELLTETAPENLAETYNPLQVKADRYDAIIRWFRKDLEYKMSVGEDDSLGAAIDDKIEEEEEAREQRRLAREAAGK